MFKIGATSSLLVLLMSFVASPVFAMDDAPSTCNNRYDGAITAMIIISDGQTYDPIADPNLTIQIENDKTYSVEFTIHTDSVSSQGNSDAGTTWYHFSGYGYWSGRCVSDAGPDTDITITTELNHPANLAPETTQAVSWATFTSDALTYNVEWVNPAPTQTVSTPPTDLAAKAVSSSKINLSWSAPQDDGGSEITDYTIERSNDHGATWSTISDTASTTYSDTGLASNTSYSYRVSAINSIGTSDPSNVASAKTYLIYLPIGAITLGTDTQALQFSLGH